MENFTEQFIKEIAKHEMHVLLDNGVYRHLRFKRSGTMCMHFDLITWPDCLCYTGDMGTYVFRRLYDMFQFFRREENQQAYKLNLKYWAEKLEAVDSQDGVLEWSPENFVAHVKDYFEQKTEDWAQERKLELWNDINDEVCSLAEEREHFALSALWDFKREGFNFRDWEGDCKVFTERFRWCCHALEWGIGIYDAHKNKLGEAC